MLQVLQQKIYDNPSTISASESGRFSLVDLIVDDDYTPSSSGLLSQTASMCSPRVSKLRHDMLCQVSLSIVRSTKHFDGVLRCVKRLCDCAGEEARGRLPEQHYTEREQRI